ncbi:hypothetical protein K474DRAFT_1671623 [Panus rudis PR-1116 ss-1]|nr:hypothetical protein K474DRAFT_1671623 [Panus rudis PR-1116 ss-1]
MRFSKRNLYYLRISANTILPLYLYLDEKHVDWMSERVLQQVLEDLRNRIPVKLSEEANAHLGPGGPSSAKKGTLDVHRGDTYQFAYFLRRTDTHAVLIKTRRFVAAPPRPKPESLPPPRPPSPEPSTKPKRRRPAPKRKVQAAHKPNKKPKTKGKGRARDEDEDEDADIVVITSEEEEVERMDAPVGPVRRSTRNRKVVAGGYREDDDEEEDEGGLLAPVTTGEDIEMAAPEANEAVPPSTDTVEPPTLDEGSTSHQDVQSLPVKIEEVDPDLPSITDIDPLPPDEPPPKQESATPAPAGPSIATNAPMDLTGDDNEEDEKPKPILKLSYQGFNVHDRCLCVIVEPYPPLTSARRHVSLAPGTGIIAPRAPSIAPSESAASGSGQPSRMPLFLPDDDDRERSQTPAPQAWQGRNLPPVPLFNEELTISDDEDDEMGMYQFSQILQSVGENPAMDAEEDDEMDGEVLFGDADEAREL